MLVLFETPAGYALFKGLKERPFEKATDTIAAYFQEDSITSTVKIDDFNYFKDAHDTLRTVNKVITNLLPKTLDEFSRNNVISEDVQNALMNYSNSASSGIASNIKVDCVLNKKMEELTKGIGFQLNSLINGLNEDEKKTMTLGLANGLSRYRLRFSTEKVDIMIIQAVSLIEDLDREISKYSSRLKEWYGWHFPELSKIVTEDVLYARTVKAIGVRNRCERLCLSRFLNEDVEAEVKEAAELSMGGEITETDENFICNLASQVLELAEYRESLTQYLTTRMNAIAPNLTQIVGGLIGAKLIAHAGSLINLAKYPASTIQILGAEKAMLKAVTTRQSTPKYGLIYQASLIGQSSDKIKGKLSRTLAAKCSVCIRVDALGESENGSVGDECKTYLETRLKFLESSLNHHERGHNYKKRKSQMHHRQPNNKEYNKKADFFGRVVKNYSREFAPGIHKRRNSNNYVNFDENDRHQIGRKKRRNSNDFKLNGQNFC